MLSLELNIWLIEYHGTYKTREYIEEYKSRRLVYDKVIFQNNIIKALLKWICFVHELEQELNVTELFKRLYNIIRVNIGFIMFEINICLGAITYCWNELTHI